MGAERKEQNLIEKLENGDIIELFKKSSDERSEFQFLSDKRFNDLMVPAKKRGAQVIRGTPEVIKHLDEQQAASSCIGNILMFRENVTISEALEELRHFDQNMLRMNNDKEISLRTILNEIDAKRHVLNEDTKHYHIPENEQNMLRKQLSWYERQLDEYMEGG